MSILTDMRATLKERTKVMAKKVVSVDSTDESVDPVAQKLAEMIGEASTISGQTTFVPLKDASGQNVTEPFKVNTYSEMIGQIRRRLAGLPKKVFEDLCVQYRVSPPAQRARV
jgi:hypothetical protein